MTDGACASVAAQVCEARVRGAQRSGVAPGWTRWLDRAASLPSPGALCGCRSRTWCEHMRGTVADHTQCMTCLCTPIRGLPSSAAACARRTAARCCDSPRQQAPGCYSVACWPARLVRDARRSGVAAGAGLQPDAADRREAVSDDLPGTPLPDLPLRPRALRHTCPPVRPTAAPARSMPRDASAPLVLCRRRPLAAPQPPARVAGPSQVQAAPPYPSPMPMRPARRAQEVETLFHEFGHALQHMLTEQADGLVAGIRGIEWDAVELPSQFMEGWRAPTRNPTAILQSRSVSAARLGVPG